MSYHDILLTECPNLQDSADRAWQTDAQNVSESLPAYELLLSEANRRPIKSMTELNGDGRFRRVEIVWDQRKVDTPETVFTTRNCEPGPQVPDFAQIYDMDLDRVVEYSETINDSELERICESNEAFFAKRLARGLDYIDRQSARGVYSEINSLYGQLGADAIAHFDLDPGADTLPVETADVNGNYKIGAWPDISLASKLSNINQPLLFGATNMEAYLQRTMAGCCANLGMDVLRLWEQNGYAFGLDTRLAEALGSAANNSLAMELGSLQVLNHTRYPGISAMNSIPDRWKFSMTTPRGMKVDVLVQTTCDGLQMNIYANFKTIARPDNLYASGDKFEGVTGTFLVEIDNPTE